MPMGIDSFVADSRFEESVAATQGIFSDAVRLLQIDGDVTDLWYDHLDHAWREPRGIIAGVTGDDALFVLEQLAWDRRRRVIYRGRHDAARNGRMRHVLEGPVSVVGAVGMADGSAFRPARIGLALSGWSGERTGMAATDVETGAGAFTRARAPVMSWIIGPAI